MSGPSAIRGFLLQSLVAILDSFGNVDWVSVTLEPDAYDEKVDILWKFPSGTRVHQVKHSINRIALSDIKRWAKALKASTTTSCELELTLLGHAAADVQNECTIGNVKVRFLSMPDPTILISSASHSLSRFLQSERLSDVPPVARELLVQALASKLLEAATSSKTITRQTLKSILKGWMLDSYPEAIKATIERERERYNKELQGLKILASAHVHNRRWLFKQKARSIKILWASMISIERSSSQLFFPYKFLLPSEFEKLPMKGRLDDSVGTLTEHQHASALSDASGPVNLARPFLPASLLRLFHAYLAFIGRTGLKVIRSRDNQGKLADWRLDFNGRTENWEGFLLQTVPQSVLNACSKNDLNGHGRIILFLEDEVLRQMNEALSANFDLDTHVREHHELIGALGRAKLWSHIEGGS